MKTAKDFYNEILSSEALQEELKAINDKDALASFLGKHGCSASARDFDDYIRSMSEGELTDDAAQDASGGISPLFGSRLVR